MNMIEQIYFVAFGLNHNNYYQYLAAKLLKSKVYFGVKEGNEQEWRYHTENHTWYLRKDKPIVYPIDIVMMFFIDK